jgi:hypothetical protein
MTEMIRKSLRDSKTARWVALGVVAFTMLTGYYLTDVIAPLKGLLEGKLGWDSSDFGFFNSAYGALGDGLGTNSSVPKAVNWSGVLNGLTAKQ